MKKIIGVIPSTLNFNSINPFDNKYYVQNSYIKRIHELGAIPIIIPPISLNLNYESIELCDAFLIIGGEHVHKYHFDIIDYALKNNKKLLGICMGMQAIAMYSNNDFEEKTLYKIKKHSVNVLTKQNEIKLIHNVNIKHDSLLYKLLGKNIKVNSVHNYAINKVSDPFKVVGKYNDVIEAIEYKNIIGVQFHPELMKNTNKLFEWLIN